MKAVSMKLDFEGAIWYWRGPAPFYFVTVPPEEAHELNVVSRAVTYGWGMVPVKVRIGKTTWETSLWPKDGSYVVPIKANIRKAEKIEEGDIVRIHLEIR